jgi:hypothetical protein
MDFEKNVKSWHCGFASLYSRTVHEVSGTRTASHGFNADLIRDGGRLRVQ